MLALVIADTILVALLGLLVAGLLRSHADILRALRDLGAPLGDPSADPAATHQHLGGDDDISGLVSPVELRRSAEGTLQMGPHVPPRRVAGAIYDIAGTTPSGDAVAFGIDGAAHRTLLAFLSSGCTGCAKFWEGLSRPDLLDLPDGVRPVIVTKGPEFEQPGAIDRLSDPAVPVVMSTEAWSDYEVPGSPFFVLADGPARHRSGEGTAGDLHQVLTLVRSALGEASGGPDHLGRVDAELRAAGIVPGDPGLYPASVGDVLGRGPDRS